MDYFYLTTNTRMKEPAALSAVSFLHVKAKSDGSKTIVITEQAVEDANCEEKTQAEAQAVLDAWIAEENSNAPTDVDGNLMLQSNISLEAFL